MRGIFGFMETIPGPVIVPGPLKRLDRAIIPGEKGSQRMVLREVLFRTFADSERSITRVHGYDK